MGNIKDQQKDLICIVCPQGCRLHVEVKDNVFTVTGNICKSGAIYGETELIAPTRMVTSTVAVENSNGKLVPVKTSKPIPKELIFDCMNEINHAVAKAPIMVGDVIIENILNTGSNIIATRNID